MERKVNGKDSIGQRVRFTVEMHEDGGYTVKTGEVNSNGQWVTMYRPEWVFESASLKNFF